MKLEHLAAYFPYGVKARFQEVNNSKCRKYVIGTVMAIFDNGSICCSDTVNSCPDRFKLVLKPLPYIDRMQILALNRFVEIQPYLKNHYDIFGLIESGEAVEIK